MLFSIPDDLASLFAHVFAHRGLNVCSLSCLHQPMACCDQGKYIVLSSSIHRSPFTIKLWWTWTKTQLQASVSWTSCCRWKAVHSLPKFHKLVFLCWWSENILNRCIRCLQSPPFPPETFGNLLLLYCKPSHGFYDLAADVLAENAELAFKYLSQVSVSHF